LAAATPPSSDAPPDPGADPATLARVRGWLSAATPSIPPTVDPEEARILYAEGGWALLDVRSALEGECEGRPLPRAPRSLALPWAAWTARYDASAGRKVVTKPPPDPAAFVRGVTKAVRPPGQGGPAGVVILCSGVPDGGDGGVLRAAAAAEALKDAPGFSTPLTILDGGYAGWALKWTNKAERRVFGFVIASGGTSIEQRGGEGSKGSGVAGKSAADLMREALINYGPGGLYE